MPDEFIPADSPCTHEGAEEILVEQVAVTLPTYGQAASIEYGRPVRCSRCGASLGWGHTEPAGDERLAMAVIRTQMAQDRRDAEVLSAAVTAAHKHGWSKCPALESADRMHRWGVQAELLGQPEACDNCGVRRDFVEVSND